MARAVALKEFAKEHLVSDLESLLAEYTYEEGFEVLEQVMQYVETNKGVVRDGLDIQGIHHIFVNLDITLFHNTRIGECKECAGHCWEIIPTLRREGIVGCSRYDIIQYLISSGYEVTRIYFYDYPGLYNYLPQNKRRRIAGGPRVEKIAYHHSPGFHFNAYTAGFFGQQKVGGDIYPPHPDTQKLPSK